MGKRTIVLVVALLLAAVSAYSVWQYLSNVEDDVRRDINEISVFRATEFIETGTTGEEAKLVIESSIALQEVLDLDTNFKILCTGEFAREGEERDQTICQQNPDNLDELLDGTVAAGPINPGQLITEDMFVSPAELNSISLSESIPQGKVAISFRASENKSSGGFIRPGDKVNIIASASVNLSGAISLLQDPELRQLILGSVGIPDDTTIPTEPGEEEQGEDAISRAAQSLSSTVQFTQTVLQNVEVLAVGADTRPSPLGTGLEPQGTQIVVVEVTPEQAELIEFADQFTSVALSLLPDPEMFPYTEFEARGVLIDDLFDLIPRIQEILEPVEGLLGN